MGASLRKFLVYFHVDAVKAYAPLGHACASSLLLV